MLLTILYYTFEYTFKYTFEMRNLPAALAPLQSDSSAWSVWAHWPPQGKRTFASFNVGKALTTAMGLLRPAPSGDSDRAVSADLAWERDRIWCALALPNPPLPGPVGLPHLLCSLLPCPHPSASQLKVYLLWHAIGLPFPASISVFCIVTVCFKACLQQCAPVQWSLNS